MERHQVLSFKPTGWGCLTHQEWRAAFKAVTVFYDSLVDRASLKGSFGVLTTVLPFGGQCVHASLSEFDHMSLCDRQTPGWCDQQLEQRLTEQFTKRTRDIERDPSLKFALPDERCLYLPFEFIPPDSDGALALFIILLDKDAAVKNATVIRRLLEHEGDEIKRGRGIAQICARVRTFVQMTDLRGLDTHCCSTCSECSFALAHHANSWPILFAESPTTHGVLVPLDMLKGDPTCDKFDVDEFPRLRKLIQQENVWRRTEEVRAMAPVVNRTIPSHDMTESQIALLSKHTMLHIMSQVFKVRLITPKDSTRSMWMQIWKSQGPAANIRMVMNTWAVLDEDITKDIRIPHYSNMIMIERQNCVSLDLVTCCDLFARLNHLFTYDLT